MKYSVLNVAAALLRGWRAAKRAVRAATWGVITRRAYEQQCAIDWALELQRRLTLPEFERLSLEEDERWAIEDGHPAPVFIALAEIPWLPPELMHGPVDPVPPGAAPGGSD